MERGSRGSGPAMAWSRSAPSRTVRVIGPLWDRAFQRSWLGQYGTRPSEGFIPKMPQSAEGIRIEPEPSEPWARGPSPAATAEPAPPEEGPAVPARVQGFRHGGPRRVEHMSL